MVRAVLFLLLLLATHAQAQTPPEPGTGPGLGAESAALDAMPPPGGAAVYTMHVTFSCGSTLALGDWTLQVTEVVARDWLTVTPLDEIPVDGDACTAVVPSFNVLHHNVSARVDVSPDIPPGPQRFVVTVQALAQESGVYNDSNEVRFEARVVALDPTDEAEDAGSVRVDEEAPGPALPLVVALVVVAAASAQRRLRP